MPDARCQIHDARHCKTLTPVNVGCDSPTSTNAYLQRSVLILKKKQNGPWQAQHAIQTNDDDEARVDVDDTGAVADCAVAIK